MTWNHTLRYWEITLHMYGNITLLSFFWIKNAVWNISVKYKRFTFNSSSCIKILLVSYNFVWETNHNWSLYIWPDNLVQFQFFWPQPGLGLKWAGLSTAQPTCWNNSQWLVGIDSTLRFLRNGTISSVSNIWPGSTTDIDCTYPWRSMACIDRLCTIYSISKHHVSVQSTTVA